MKTAVEWLADQLKKQGFLYDLDIEAAKEKEKEQIRDAYNEGHTDAMLEKPGMTSGTIYYNQTFKPETI